MNENELQQEILRRLDIIICLMLDRPAPDKATSVSSMVHKLGGLGLSPSEIAKILGKPVNYITAVNATRRTRKG